MSLIKISPNSTKCSSKIPSWYLPFSYVYTHRGLNPQQWLKTLPFLQLYMKKLVQTVKRLPAVWETRVWSLGWEDPPEKAMATHSRTLAWKIPWTEEPGGLQSMGVPKSRTWLSTQAHAHKQSYENSEAWVNYNEHGERRITPSELMITGGGSSGGICQFSVWTKGQC